MVQVTGQDHMGLVLDGSVRGVGPGCGFSSLSSFPSLVISRVLMLRPALPEILASVLRISGGRKTTEEMYSVLVLGV